MKLLVKSAKIINKRSSHHGHIADLLIDNGIIEQIGTDLSVDGARILSGDGLCVSTGWMDMRVASTDPGFEFKEDLHSLKEVAARGGFTEILLLPNSSPVVQNKSAIKYIQQAGKGAVCMYASAAATLNTDGVDFTEMMDLHQAGAIAFTDGNLPVQNADLVLKTLQYLLPLNTVLMNRPEDRQLALYGHMHEGVTSTMLGLKGIPSLAEEMMVIRDIKLLQYCLEKNISDVRAPLLHFSLISSAEAVGHIREAKKMGLPVSCDIAAHQLAFIDEDLIGFDTNLKVSPPFRSQMDREVLLKGLLDGTIDTIVSDHNPHDEESKNLEFDHADFGIIGLETMFSLSLKHSGLIIEELIEVITDRPRNILRLNNPVIEQGEKANLTFFEPDSEWIFDKSYSKSKNSPFIGSLLKGKVRGIYNQNEFLSY